MKRFFCVLAALLLILASLMPTPAAVPQHEGIARVTGAVQDCVGMDTAGAAVILFENGSRILYEGYGYADISARTLVTAQSCFEIGEISSLFVALGVHALADEGKVELDRDIAYYLPADFMKKLDLSHTVTLNDLLAGRAGFADRYFDLRYTDPSLVFDTLEQALLAEVPAQSEPTGNTYAYSRFGLTLAAFVLECASGTDYATYVSEKILTPLGMTNTVLAPHVQTAEKMAAGHTVKGEGSFAVVKDAGRSYSALWPADGAVSNAADLSLLLQYLLGSEMGEKILTPALENGVFQTGIAGLGVSGSVRAMRASVLHFSASLAIDPENGSAALVLCNTDDTALLDAPYAYCGFLSGAVAGSDNVVLPDPTEFEGEYILRTKTNGVLLSRGVKNIRISVDDTGMLLFGDKELVQIAPGIFADPADKAHAVLQFQTDIEGNVTGLITASGESYRVAEWQESNVIVNLLFVALSLGAVYFLLGGILALADALLSRARGERRPRAWRFTLPWVFASVSGLVVLIQILVCDRFGAATIASFRTACATISLIFVIGAVCGFVYALFTAFTVRRMTARVARSAIIYVLFLAVCGYWGVILI